MILFFIEKNKKIYNAFVVFTAAVIILRIPEGIAVCNLVACHENVVQVFFFM